MYAVYAPRFARLAAMNAKGTTRSIAGNVRKRVTVAPRNVEGWRLDSIARTGAPPKHEKARLTVEGRH